MATHSPNGDVIERETSRHEDHLEFRSGDGGAAMKVGISLTSAHDVTDPREAARWMIERTAAARRAGLDSLFIGDHHA